MKKLDCFLIIAAVFLLNICRAQIPNGSFEQITGAGHTSPNDWNTSDDIIDTSPYYSQIVMNGGAPGSGSKYSKLIGVKISSNAYKSGFIATNTFEYSYSALWGESSSGTGFAFAQRPANLSGFWQYKNMATDPDAQILVYGLLSKWNSINNSRDTIAVIKKYISGNVPAWTSFNLPFQYKSNLLPDSAALCFIAGLEVDFAKDTSLDFLCLDNLSLTGVSVINNCKNTMSTFDVFPNPASDIINLRVDSPLKGKTQIEIYNEFGQIVLTRLIELSSDNPFSSVDISLLQAGIYFIRSDNAGFWETRMLVIK